MTSQARLNQILAVEKGVKSSGQGTLTGAHHQLQKPALLSGISRSYRPKDDDGDQLPPEATLVQTRVAEALAGVEAALTRWFDVTLTKDAANCDARADIVMDGVTLAGDVPVTYLLFLEKQLVELHTFVSKLPVLDASETWRYDPAVDAYATEPTQTTRTKKVPRNHVKSEATDKHPAQVDVYYEDVLVGYWTTIKYSGALPQSRVNDMRARVAKLAEAVKVAREKANSTPITDRAIGSVIFSYLFG